MHAPVRPMPRWLRALLIGEVVGAAAVGVGLCVMFLIVWPPSSSYDKGLVIVFAILPVLIAAGAAWLTWREWRAGNASVATVLAVLPLMLVVPYAMWLVAIS